MKEIKSLETNSLAECFWYRERNLLYPNLSQTVLRPVTTPTWFSRTRQNVKKSYKIRLFDCYCRPVTLTLMAFEGILMAFEGIYSYNNLQSDWKLLQSKCLQNAFKCRQSQSNRPAVTGLQSPWIERWKSR